MQRERLTKSQSSCYVFDLYSHTATTLTTLLTLLWAPPALAPSDSLPHQLGIPIQLLIHFRHSLPGESTRSHGVRAQSHKTASHFRCWSQVGGPQVTHSSEWATNRKFPWPSHRGADDLLGQLAELRETLMLTTSLKGRKGQMEASTRGGLGGTRAQDHLSLWTWAASLSRDVDVFTHLEGPHAPILLGFDGGFLMLAQWIIQATSGPSPHSGEWGNGAEHSKLLIMAWPLW